MALIDDIRTDAKEIVTNQTDFALPCTFDDGTNPPIEAAAVFLRRTNTLEYDDGSKQKTPYSSLITDYDIFNFSEKYITLKGWTVTVEGNDYIIEQSNPNRTTGLIQCDLKDSG